LQIFTNTNNQRRYAVRYVACHLLLDVDIPVTRCNRNQSLEGCRGCTASSRRCLNCGFTNGITDADIGLCEDCAKSAKNRLKELRNMSSVARKALQILMEHAQPLGDGSFAVPFPDVTLEARERDLVDALETMGKGAFAAAGTSATIAKIVSESNGEIELVTVPDGSLLHISAKLIYSVREAWKLVKATKQYAVTHEFPVPPSSELERPRTFIPCESMRRGHVTPKPRVKTRRRQAISDAMTTEHARRRRQRLELEPIDLPATSMPADAQEPFVAEPVVAKKYDATAEVATEISAAIEPAAQELSDQAESGATEPTKAGEPTSAGTAEVGPADIEQPAPADAIEATSPTEDAAETIPPSSIELESTRIEEPIILEDTNAAEIEPGLSFDDKTAQASEPEKADPMPEIVHSPRRAEAELPRSGIRPAAPKPTNASRKQEVVHANTRPLKSATVHASPKPKNGYGETNGKSNGTVKPRLAKTNGTPARTSAVEVMRSCASSIDRLLSLLGSPSKTYQSRKNKSKAHRKGTTHAAK
jgi:hypothetical protein